MTRNIVAPETAEHNRTTAQKGGYTFHAPVAADYEGTLITVAVVRLGDHAHLDISSGRSVPQPDRIIGSGPRGHAGRVVLRWHEWELLRSVLDAADFVHIAEVETPTIGQIRFHTEGEA